jgi:molybdopterin-guanine dinucleotide biosynthesis protein B
VVGARKCGKTSLLERLIPEMERRGLRVAALKNDAHGFEMDREGKDTWRLRRAGAGRVGICCGGEAAFLLGRDEPWPLEDLLDLVAGDADLVLVEGKGRSSLPKIIVHRQGAEERYHPRDLSNVVAMVAGTGDWEGLPRYGPEDATGIADRILEVLGLKR